MSECTNNDRPTRSSRHIVRNLGVVGALLVGGQVVYDHTISTSKPDFNVFDPLTWVATPLDGVIDEVNADRSSGNVQFSPNLKAPEVEYAANNAHNIVGISTIC